MYVAPFVGEWGRLFWRRSATSLVASGFGRAMKKRRKIDTQRFGHAKKRVDRWGSLTLLNTHHHGAINSGAGGDFAHRKSLAYPFLAKQTGEMFDD